MENLKLKVGDSARVIDTQNNSFKMGEIISFLPKSHKHKGLYLFTNSENKIQALQRFQFEKLPDETQIP